MTFTIKQIFLSLLFLYGYQAYPATIEVSKSGQNSIQKAIDQANPHDTIVVLAGTYREHDILIEKPLNIRGVGRPVIDAGHAGQIIVVGSDSVAISGFQIQNVGFSFTKDWAAILIDNKNYCRIEDNILVDAYYGIYLKKSNHIVIRGNRLEGKAENEINSGNGIHLWYCDSILIENNHIKGHRDGIYFEFVENSTIVRNTSEANVRYGLHFMFSNNDDYIGNTFKNNGTGVAVMFSEHINMINNHFIDNWGTTNYGLLFKEISDGELSGNLFKNNTVGIFADGTNRMKISKNEFVENGWAMNVFSNCMNNEIVDNNFISNTFDLITNSAKHHNHYHHNYWDQYSGYDLDKDGIGDVPHRPVKLFSYLIGKVPESIILLRSFFIDIINMAEKVAPVLTPESLMDEQPRMKIITDD
ncbi:MAG: nitrous oxide reductase family maturation protein NosD [Cyclobacteriaceae bacterium]|nr:nitrous oxide reductase family maturation protein NosD [Cyclobacteriaceae bacterium]